MILCCGEALIDMIPSPDPSGGALPSFTAHPGGAVFNTAVALGRLGVETGLLTGLSTDLFGGQLEQALAASRVDCSRAARSGRPTTLAFVELTGGHARYSFFDANSAGRMLAPEDLPDLDGSVSALFFGGISLACEPGAETYAGLLEREGGSRAVMLDPNIRPGFITDEPRFRARLDRMIRQSDIVKLSDEDLDWLVPGPQAPEDKAADLQAKGPTMVIITLGSKGAAAFLDGGRSVTAPAQPAVVADTVGAGDTFNAGVMARLTQLGLLDKQALRSLTDANVQSALAYGCAAAAVTVSRAGANPPWAEDMPPL